MESVYILNNLMETGNIALLRMYLVQHVPHLSGRRVGHDLLGYRLLHAVQHTGGDPAGDRIFDH
jgi:hypothetical protein